MNTIDVIFLIIVIAFCIYGVYLGLRENMTFEQKV